MSEPLWRPSPERIAAANLTAFIDRVNRKRGVGATDFASLWRWSVDDSGAFWAELWDFCAVIAETRGDRALVDGDRMPGARFFPDARLNFAENLLRRRDDAPGIVFRREDGLRREMSFAELARAVARLAEALEREGVKPGDRVAGYLPNMPETIVAALAAASIGATWSSCSPDFGERGVLDRFGQIEPVVLFFVDAYVYNGKAHDSLDRVSSVLEGLPSVRRTVVVPFVSDDPDIADIRGGMLLDDFVAGTTA
ncbi:MAG: AMP-binding protein, partial [Acetobacterales bacterium]